MYSIFYKDTCIYDDRSPLKNLKLTEPNLVMEENSAGSLKFKMDSKATAFTLLERMKTGIVVKRDGNEIWWGRALTMKEDFFKRKEVYCEGALSYLNDTYQLKAELKGYTWHQYLEYVLNYHNSKVEADKRFYIGICEYNDGDEGTEDDDLEEEISLSSDITDDNVIDEDIIKDKYTAYEKTFKTVMDVVNDFNGFVRLRRENNKFYIDFLKNTRNRCAQVIEFGKNLLDFTRNYDMSNLCTVLFPLGAAIERDVNTVGKEKTITFQNGIRRLVSKDNKASTSTTDGNSPAKPLTGDYAVSTAISVKGGDKLYYSGRMNNGYGMYMVTDNSLKTYLFKRCGDEEGFTDIKNELITIPAGATRLYVAGVDRTNYPVEIHEYSEEQNNLDDYVNVTSVNNGNYTVENKEAIKEYGRIEAQHYWPKISDPQTLLDRANAFLKNYQFDEMVIDITAVDLHLLNPEIDTINVLDEIRCTSNPHGMDHIFPVTRTEIPLGNPSNQRFQLNYSKHKKSLTASTSETTSQIYERIAEKPSAKSVLLDAYKNASALLNEKTNGFVVYEKDETLWMNSPDKESATSVWRFNVNGLGHSSGEGAYYMRDNMNLAFTRDGQIVADRITTGHMSADRIYGGILQLGGQNNQNGQMTIKDSDGFTWAKWNSDELRIGNIEKFMNVDPNDFMDTSLFESKKMFGIKFDNGVMKQYYNGSYDGWIGTNLHYDVDSKGSLLTRMGISARYAIVLTTPKLYVKESVASYKSTMNEVAPYRGYTGTIKHFYSFQTGENNGLEWKHEDLRFVNGLLVHYTAYPNDEQKYEAQTS